VCLHTDVLLDSAATRRLLLAVAALVATALLTACGSGGAGTGGGTTRAASGTSAGSSLAPAAPVSDLPTVTVGQLPAQAVTTLRLIASGGPFPYAKDGVVFSNREGILPKHPSGWYHEYTVITPGSNDRGARRIVKGSDGGLFYTDDHYASFREIVSGGSS
jgi:ribonuclease T1